MEKNYYANLEYNRRKKNQGIILSALLILFMLGTVSVFVATKQYTFVIPFAAILLLPIFTIPSIFKNYPTDNRVMVCIKDKEITMDNTTCKLKDITKIRVTIELPASRLDSENKQTLEKLVKEKPEDVYFGNFDLVVKDSTGKKKVLYSHIDGVIDALNTLLSLGVKYYEVRYTIKKQSALLEYDMRNDIIVEKEKALQTTSKKERKKQLL